MATDVVYICKEDNEKRLTCINLNLKEDKTNRVKRKIFKPLFALSEEVIRISRVKPALSGGEYGQSCQAFCMRYSAFMKK